MGPCDGWHGAGEPSGESLRAGPLHAAPEISLRIQAGAAHPSRHREVTILSGTWYTAYGTQFDETALKALPAGSFYTEPANVANFVEVREPVIIQVSGMGPS